MTPNELYNLKPIRSDFDVAILFGCYYNHMPEIEHLYTLPVPDNTRVEIRYYKDHSYDGRRIWRLASVWLDGYPFMIIRNAGREGDDFADRFITNEAKYQAANRTSANAVDRDTVDQVSVPIVQPRTNIAREETQRRRLDGGESKPADFSSRFQDSVGWVETYKALWEFKTTRWEKDRS